uniref:Uncharacterized protein n=1 Tax=Salix viminalis TaxID=40686 RepID=A0A6N2LN09_SALVM
MFSSMLSQLDPATSSVSRLLLELSLASSCSNTRYTPVFFTIIVFPQSTISSTSSSLPSMKSLFDKWPCQR